MLNIEDTIKFIVVLCISSLFFISILRAESACEKAIVNATIIGMKYAENKIGFRATVVADNNVTKICKGK